MIHRPGAIIASKKQPIPDPLQAKSPDREKLVLWRNKASTGNSTEKNYMQFDDELKNSVITGIRVYPSGEGVTTPWVDGVAVADFLTLTYVNVTFVGKDNQKLLEHYPVATLVHTNTVNRKCVAEFKMRFVPEKSYLSIPFIAGWGVDTYVAFVFTYRPY